MRRVIVILAAALLAVHGLAMVAQAQKGAGEASGVARQAVKPAVVSLEGKLLEIKTGPCESTTGRAAVGTHILVETADKEVLNVHLGPATAVADTVKKLTIGQELSIKAFRTDKLKEHHYVAVSLTFDKTTVALRDESLRPVWAGGGQGRGPGAAQGGRGAGRGQGAGRGAGRGQGGGRGPMWRNNDKQD